MPDPVILNAIEAPAPGPDTGERAPVVFLHGVFGNARNFAGVLRRLHPDFSTLSLDLRNHGQSPHTRTMSYPAMAGDVLATLDKLGVGRFALVGHSMGGKVAMMVAALAPERLAHLVVEDIAPVTYSDRYSAMIDRLLAAPHDLALSRTDIEASIEELVPNPQTRAFLLQNYVRGRERWEWRCNLAAIRASLDDLLGFPAGPPVTGLGGATLIAGGERGLASGDRDMAAFLERFPAGNIVSLPKAGHWVHVDDPEGFDLALRTALD